jgi:hypothetical protein
MPRHTLKYFSGPKQPTVLRFPLKWSVLILFAMCLVNYSLIHGP